MVSSAIAGAMGSGVAASAALPDFPCGLPGLGASSRTSRAGVTSGPGADTEPDWSTGTLCAVGVSFLGAAGERRISATAATPINSKPPMPAATSFHETTGLAATDCALAAVPAPFVCVVVALTLPAPGLLVLVVTDAGGEILIVRSPTSTAGALCEDVAFAAIAAVAARMGTPCIASSKALANSSPLWKRSAGFLDSLFSTTPEIASGTRG